MKHKSFIIYIYSWEDGFGTKEEDKYGKIMQEFQSQYHATELLMLMEVVVSMLLPKQIVNPSELVWCSRI